VTLAQVRELLQPGGRLIFETGDPMKQVWLGWNRKNSYRRIDVPNIDPDEGWVELTDVQGAFVPFLWTYIFERDGGVLIPDSTLR